MSEFGIAKYNSTEVHNRGYATASYGDDSAVFAEFYHRPVKMEFQSEQEGRPIFKDVPYLCITFPGDRTKNWDQPVKMNDDSSGPSDPHRFPRQWEAFQRQQEQIPDGTPLTEFAAFGRARVMELKAMNIHTVEQFAGVPDGQIESLGLGARKERDLCRNSLDKTASLSHITKLESENEVLKADISLLQQQVKELGRMMQPSEDQQTVRRGRPPKAVGE